MSVKSVEELLKELRLHTAASELEETLRQSSSNISLSWLVNLLQREIDSRREKQLQSKIKASKIPDLKSIENFDWNFNPTINKEKVLDLSKLKFIKEKEVVLFLGQPGTGKSHLSQAIGLKAIMEGKNVYWSSIKVLVEDILKAKSRNELSKLFKKILSSDLWILDDWAVIGLSREVSEEVFDLLDRRKNNTAMLLTSNRDINEWPQVFVDPVLASAAIDRIFDRPNITIFSGKSYRASGSRDKRVEKLSELRV
jgi:DNA replication protein DnaC